MGKRKPTSVAAKKKPTEPAKKPADKESEFGHGSSLKKNSDYLGAITARIRTIRSHPRHHNVGMQAHHLISSYAVNDLLPTQVRKNIEYFNYNINCLENLVFLPCTLQGACHLGVQLHRGNHTAIGKPDEQDATENDSAVFLPYHNSVAVRLKAIAPLMKKHCVGELEKAELHKLSAEICGELNKVSGTVLLLIQNAPSQMPLTKLYAFFQPGHGVGCGGVDNIPADSAMHAKQHCAVGRDHLQRQRDGQNVENIKYKKVAPYLLEVGK
ncbi:AHH domain-containing protein [Piscinibacter gummiphilus]|uniref:AHH domain-containing protein n=1 Tax=Piscinibacter gummiphilus TaxID=946333 RepID=A0ABZ0D7U2_9BURK|nr:AHH domain-containing protein [Piscinibacter gummiphilus]WOB11337.1 AHH domain-containing protein [Piscinibacter gummiphilus]